MMKILIYKQIAFLLFYCSRYTKFTTCPSTQVSQGQGAAKLWEHIALWGDTKLQGAWQGPRWKVSHH